MKTKWACRVQLHLGGTKWMLSWSHVMDTILTFWHFVLPVFLILRNIFELFWNSSFPAARLFGLCCCCCCCCYNIYFIYMSVVCTHIPCWTSCKRLVSHWLDAILTWHFDKVRFCILFTMHSIENDFRTSDVSYATCYANQIHEDGIPCVPPLRIVHR